MFSEYETVRIKASGIVGEIVDIATAGGRPVYTVESNTKGPIEGGYGDVWPLFECLEDEIERV